MKEKLHIELTVPKYWTGKQAKTVWEFLESIMEAIWEVHGDEIDEAIEEEQAYLLAAARGELPEPSDDYPF
ncbi:MAG: hypothetical protein GY847_04125 [Proteobacteria bacterium]|nr:hypothetical protein [Pseudomonadota bacterium]